MPHDGPFSPEEGGVSTIILQTVFTASADAMLGVCRTPRSRGAVVASSSGEVAADCDGHRQVPCTKSERPTDQKGDRLHSNLSAKQKSRSAARQDFIELVSFGSGRNRRLCHGAGMRRKLSPQSLREDQNAPGLLAGRDPLDHGLGGDIHDGNVVGKAVCGIEPLFIRGKADAPGAVTHLE